MHTVKHIPQGEKNIKPQRKVGIIQKAFPGNLPDGILNKEKLAMANKAAGSIKTPKS